MGPFNILYRSIRLLRLCLISMVIIKTSELQNHALLDTKPYPSQIYKPHRRHKKKKKKSQLKNQLRNQHCRFTALRYPPAQRKGNCPLGRAGASHQ